MWEHIDHILIFLIAVMNAYTVYISHRTEKNTNSMKDALVAATAAASLAEGVATGILQGRSEVRANPPNSL